MSFAPNFFGGGGGGDATLANQQAILAAIAAVQAKTDLINPSGLTLFSRLVGSGGLIDVVQYEHEKTTGTFTVDVDYTATQLEVIWELESQNTEIAKLADASLTKTATTIAINEIPVAVRSTVRTLKYSIRVVSTELVIVTGNWVVSRAPRDRS